MTADPAGATDLVEVVLLRYPLHLGSRATEHYEDLFREMALQASADPDEVSVPARLLATVERLGRHYPQQQEHEVEREQAIARGETTRDMVVRLPADAGDVARRLDVLMDEADAFCRDGELLTLAPPEGVVAFRKWYIAEVIAQTEGRDPTPWPGASR